MPALSATLLEQLNASKDDVNILLTNGGQKGEQCHIFQSFPILTSFSSLVRQSPFEISCIYKALFLSHKLYQLLKLIAEHCWNFNREN